MKVRISFLFLHLLNILRLVGKIFDGISYPLFFIIKYSESERKLEHNLMDFESES